MATETLHFENARVAQQLFNNDTRNLQTLEQQLGVKATSREGWIKLEGEADALERAKNLFLSLEGSLPAGWLTRDASPGGVIGDAIPAAVDKGERMLEASTDQLSS